MSGREFRSGFKKMMYGESPFWDILLEGVAELVGTAILMFLGCMGCVGSLGVQPSHLQSTLTFGLAVMLVIQCFGHISNAHLNPAITVGAVVLGKKTVVQAVVYFFAQMIGAIIGYGVLKVVTPTGQLYYNNENATDQFCVTVVNVNWYQGLMIETITTGILLLLACAIWDERNANNTDSAAIKFGLSVTCLAAVAGPYTGCSMNPARSFAPAIWNNQWTDLWIYWLGPLVGSFLSTLGYRVVFGYKSNKTGQTIPEAVALNCVDAEKREHL